MTILTSLKCSLLFDELLHNLMQGRGSKLSH